MKCELAGTTVHAYFDGELDAIRSAEFEVHADNCAECQAQLKALGIIRKQIKENDLFERASLQLAKRVHTQISQDGNESPDRFLRPQKVVLISSLAVVAATVISFAILFFIFQSHSQSSRVTVALLDAHVRSLQSGHLTDILSTDQHTVKPWFDGKLDFIPPVTDFSQQGFPLIGGRLDVIDGHNAAALAYGRRKHIINLFVWLQRAHDESLSSSGSQQGYNWLRWQSNHMEFCLVSDTSDEDLRTLKDFIRQQSH